jgi:ectoine hydroxylase-related dioxygenase (phytanoyl-CoA dioxygenase family)
MTQPTSTAPRPDTSAKPRFSQSDVEEFQRTFAEHGYVVIPDVVSKERLSRLAGLILAEFERLVRLGGLFTGGGLMAGHLNCCPGEESRFAYDALEHQGILDVMRAISPKSAAGVLRVGLNLNLPKSVAQNYHIDGYFEKSFMIANVAVVDTDIVNGALEVAPGSHKRAYKYWQFAVRGLARPSARVPLKQGDVVLRPSSLWHRGMPNRAAVARPMLGFTFGESGMDPGDPFAKDDGKITFQPNRFKTDFLGRLRERSYVAVPIAHSAARFAMSLLANKG